MSAFYLSLCPSVYLSPPLLLHVVSPCGSEESVHFMLHVSGGRHTEAEALLDDVAVNFVVLVVSSYKRKYKRKYAF